MMRGFFKSRRRLNRHGKIPYGIGLGIRPETGGQEFGVMDIRTGKVEVYQSQAAAHNSPYRMYTTTPYDTVMRRVDRYGKSMSDWIIDYIPDP